MAPVVVAIDTSAGSSEPSETTVELAGGTGDAISVVEESSSSLISNMGCSGATGRLCVVGTEARAESERLAKVLAAVTVDTVLTSSGSDAELLWVSAGLTGGCMRWGGGLVFTVKNSTRLTQLSYSSNILKRNYPKTYQSCCTADFWRRLRSCHRPTAQADEQNRDLERCHRHRSLLHDLQANLWYGASFSQRRSFSVAQKRCSLTISLLVFAGHNFISTKVYF